MYVPPPPTGPPGAGTALTHGVPAQRAVAARVPTVVLHGASSVGGWTRPTAWHRALHANVPCRPRHRETCAPGGVPCLSEVGPEPVFALVRAALALPPEPPLVVPVRAARAPVG